jgi:single-strand DNA-binding protein
MNQLTIVGNLGGDPEMRYLEDGTPVTTFSVAVNRRWTDQATGEQREKTWWFRVTAWRRLAEVCNQYLQKGKQVLVQGEVSASAYTAEGGEVRASLEVTARNVRFLGQNGGNGAPPALSDEELAEQDMPF